MLIARRTCIKLMEDALQEPVRMNCGLVGRSGPRIQGQSTVGAARKGPAFPDRRHHQSQSGDRIRLLPSVLRSGARNFFIQFTHTTFQMKVALEVTNDPLSFHSTRISRLNP